MVQKPENDIEPKERRIDLSLPQVAGSAVAAVAAAVLASQLGVYGTIAGAGVMSVVATCGGSVFQHFFRRTGEQIREVTVQVTHPEGRQVTVHTKETTPSGRGDTERRTGQEPAGDATTVLPAVGPEPESTQVLRPDPDRTQLLPRAVVGPAGADDAFSDGVTHGTRLRGWKRPALAAAVVFGVSMGGITAYEMISGSELSGGQGTTLSSVVRGGGDRDPGPAGPTHSGDTGQDGERGERRETPGEDGTGSTPTPDQGDGSSKSPDPGTGTGGEDPSAEPTPTPSHSSGGETTPSPTPTPSNPGGETGAPPPTGTGGAPGQGEQAPPDAG
ncbi:hypothetical protein CIB93_27520 [Streptomyces sp. WZ.A104]|uniref:hypothetical protein n=1 Tax=Streptomyces sp. WZ.A104 TaxID=2023771 RepID=UPI000BBC7613|nr:hypothetical protein [Streptomyces sp. WZ.A104]PCG82919.1 hypothetical protein CIB93_27520 [Streptomyces sp. WZ.A104]